MENEVAGSPESGVSAGSPSAEVAQDSVNTPPMESMGSEQLSQYQVPNQSVPYGRFKEVIAQKNEYATRMEDMERRLSAYETNLVKNRSSSVVDTTVSKLVAAGLDENAAKLLVETQNSLLEARMQERLSPIEQQNKQYSVERWVNDFASSHSDYKSLEPHMEQQFAKLNPQEQQFVAGNPAGLEMLYWKVKGQLAQNQIPGARQQGINQAYQTMGQKAAMSSTPGSAPVKAALTKDSISKMDQSEYVARRSEIMDAMAKGLIR